MGETSSAEYSFETLVVEQDPNHYKTEEDVYEFSNDRKFKNDDNSSGGVYSGS
jgi:hypothetical protein